MGRRRHRLGLGPARGDRGVLGEGPPAPRRGREPGPGSRSRRDAPGAGGRRARARRSRRARSPRRRRGVPARAGGVRDDPRLRRAGRSGWTTHLERLAGSAERLGLPRGRRSPPSAGSCARRSRPRATPDAVLRLYLTPGREGGGHPTALAMVSTLPPDLEERRARGLRLITVQLGHRARRARRRALAPRRRQVDELRGQHGRRGGGAAPRRRRRRLPRQRPDRPGGPGDQRLVAHAAANLFTPALELGILAGVTRATLLESAAEPRLRGPRGRLSGRATWRAPRRRSRRRRCAR